MRRLTRTSNTNWIRARVILRSDHRSVRLDVSLFWRRKRAGPVHYYSNDLLIKASRTKHGTLPWSVVHLPLPGLVTARARLKMAVIYSTGRVSRNPNTPMGKGPVKVRNNLSTYSGRACLGVWGGVARRVEGVWIEYGKYELSFDQLPDSFCLLCLLCLTRCTRRGTVAVAVAVAVTVIGRGRGGGGGEASPHYHHHLPITHTHPIP